MKERLKFLESQKQTKEVKLRINELTISMVRVQQIMIAKRDNPSGYKTSWIEQEENRLGKDLSMQGNDGILFGSPDSKSNGVLGGTDPPTVDELLDDDFTREQLKWAGKLNIPSMGDAVVNMGLHRNRIKDFIDFCVDNGIDNGIHEMMEKFLKKD